MPMPNDGTVATRSQLAFVQAIRCDLAASRHEFATAVALTDDLRFPQRPFTRCFVGAMRGAIELTVGEHEEAGRSADELIQLGERHGFQFWSVVGMMLRGMVDHQTGDRDASARVEMAISMLNALDVIAWQPSWLSSLAVGHLRHGEVDLAAASLDRAEAVAERTGSRYWSAEIARVRHDVRLAGGQSPDPAMLRQAVDLAVAQGATLFELRARADLCRHADDPADRQALADLIATLPDDGLAERDAAGALVGRA